MAFFVILKEIHVKRGNIMEKKLIVDALNRDWKAFFQSKRLDWITADFNAILLDYLENLSFLNVDIQEEQKGLSESPFSIYLLEVELSSVLRGHPHTFSMMTVDKDTDELEFWKHDGWISVNGSYDGSGQIEGVSLHEPLSLSFIEGKRLEQIFIDFGLREKIENPLYQWFRQSERDKEQALLDALNQPLVVQHVKVENGEVVLTFSDGTVFSGIQGIYQNNESLL